MTFSFATAGIIYVALEIIYILESSSLIIEPRYLNLIPYVPGDQRLSYLKALSHFLGMDLRVITG